MFGTLLTWMQERTAPVFLIATANDIEALPPELLRKGRFDEIFFVDLPDSDARRTIFHIHLKKRRQDPRKFDLDRLSAAAEGYSGAEIEQAIIAAMHNAFAQRAELSTDLVNEALQHSPPLSVTMAEKVDALRRWSEGRCVSAD
jgi:SpoVK/Ycf46/Vps4 family AAA+-type ATPase